MSRRARSEEAKQQRREQILDGAEALWADQSFAGFSMAALAASLSLAKGTLYLYFQTKEELFLALLERQLAGWFAELGAALAAAPPLGPAAPPLGPAAAAELLGRSLERRPALTRLLPIASSILEHNISAAAARAYKARLLAWCADAAPALEARLSFMRPGDGIQLLLLIYALVVGLGQMADPAPVVAEVLANPAMAPLRVELGPDLRRALELILGGMAARP